MKYINPESMFTPPGAQLNWGVLSPPNAQILFASGVVALDKDGRTPTPEDDQAALVFENIQHLLTEAGLRKNDIVKVNAYFVTDAAYSAFVKHRAAFFDGGYPASTGLFVPKLVSDKWKLEIEFYAAKEIDDGAFE